MGRLHRIAALGALLAAVLPAVAAPALAAPVVLRANPVDDDGHVTLGDLFEGAGAASNVAVAQRVGPSVVLEAGQLQAMASQAGLEWSNPNGLRRVVVRRALAPAQTANQAANQAAPASAGLEAAAPQVRAAYRPTGAGQQVIARNDMVRVIYQVGGVNLSVMGKAMRNAAAGEPLAIMNVSSNRLIEAVATGPGQAVAGPAADLARANPQQFAAR
ncbi:flagella basal body P-ring formation protein FlgA [Brevundimonas sp. SORGH_AS_0993]|uniref:flagella basal body P-ring formation protein FlgA n=1 Tax=Brevundimonas sp. SORGH_AS_0993 TaxID=3041794 RepID=UPI0027872D31|nr:flagella basal body P-ring formation protein FlgA [Brevundimonas sp. SORGH_AS_0993]MDQ1154070.1 flagella basal body P-ring formation protein FlgA [Brevundimonas sp. SORGH_AS_0993]